MSVPVAWRVSSRLRQSYSRDEELDLVDVGVQLRGSVLHLSVNLIINQLY